MMYNNKFVMAIKHNGEVLKEFKDTVYVPFGSEYSIFLKNLNTVRATAKIWIDSNLVTEGVDLVVPPNGSIDLERFIKNGNMNQGNRFKFIERNSVVEQYRGIGAEDGLIRVEFKFEKVVPKYHWNNFGTATYKSLGDNIIRSRSISDGTVPCSAEFTYSNCSDSLDTFDCDTTSKGVINEAGITAAGSISDQTFTTIGWFATEDESYSMVLKLLGKTSESPVMAPVLVSSKPKCVTCGKNNKASSKFCSACGTSLQIV